MKRFAAIAVVTGLIIAGALLFAKREPFLLSWVGSRVETQSLEERIALLAPAIETRAPASGAPPYPAVIQFHGCAGYRPHLMEQWAEVANASGFLAVMVDSTGPRGIDRDEALATVCEGKQLLGQERAGDVLAAYEWTRRRDDVDPARIVLAGWSHGGWSVMDLEALTAAGRVPPGIDGPRPALDIAGLIAVYPYCGPGAWTRVSGWKDAPPALMLLAAEDTIVDTPQCVALAERLRRNGADIETQVYPGADHVFDDREFPDYYDADALEQAEQAFSAFLARVKG